VSGASTQKAFALHIVGGEKTKTEATMDGNRKRKEKEGTIVLHMRIRRTANATADEG
jgi:hypothetical protein